MLKRNKEGRIYYENDTNNLTIPIPPLRKIIAAFVFLFLIAPWIVIILNLEIAEKTKGILNSVLSKEKISISEKIVADFHEHTTCGDKKHRKQERINKENQNEDIGMKKKQSTYNPDIVLEEPEDEFN
jgi:maltodextrin utilization protein YvdJ